MLRELVVNPLDAAATRELAAVTLGAELAPALADTLYDRTQGVPFFVQELALGLQAGDRLREGPTGLELEHDADVPVPETIRDAVLLRTMGLTDAGRAAAEAAAVVGSEFRLDLAPAIDELLQAGLIVESRPGHGAFRHALVRGAIYEDIPWRRRRDLHAAFADALEFGGGANAAIAAHRLAAGDRERALEAYLAAAHELARVHAHRDAAAAALQALDLWRDGERPAERLAALDTYARSAELAGDLAEATRALREAVAIRQAAIDAMGDARARGDGAPSGGEAPRGHARGAGRDRSAPRRAVRAAGRSRARAAGAARCGHRVRSRGAARGGGGGAAGARRVRAERRAASGGGGARARRRGRRAAAPRAATCGRGRSGSKGSRGPSAASTRRAWGRSGPGSRSPSSTS